MKQTHRLESHCFQMQTRRHQLRCGGVTLFCIIPKKGWSGCGAGSTVPPWFRDLFFHLSWWGTQRDRQKQCTTHLMSLFVHFQNRRKEKTVFLENKFIYLREKSYCLTRSKTVKKRPRVKSEIYKEKSGSFNLLLLRTDSRTACATIVMSSYGFIPQDSDFFFLLRWWQVTYMSSMTLIMSHGISFMIYILFFS